MFIQQQFEFLLERHFPVMGFLVYRIFDHHKKPVASLVVLADDRPGWRPNQFGYALWGCEVGITFPVVKLMDYQSNLAELERSRNPFAIAVMVLGGDAIL
jgi:hypothetical protein